MAACRRLGVAKQIPAYASPAGSPPAATVSFQRPFHGRQFNPGRIMTVSMLETLLLAYRALWLEPAFYERFYEPGVLP